MKIKCPACAHEISVSATAVVPASQRLVLEMTKVEGCEDEMWAAKTIGEVIIANRKLLIAVAKDLGATVEIFVSSMTMISGKVSIEFTIVQR